MDKVLYVSMTGAKQTMLGQAAHANNLANAKTTGFKQDFEQFRAMPVFGDGLPTRAFAMQERPASDTRQGSLMTTGRDLDIAVHGDGWMVVQDAKGQDAFTRAGNLLIDPNGFLVNGNGHMVMGDGDAPISIPPYERIEIGNDGTIAYQPLGAPAGALEVVDRIRLVSPESKTLFKGDDGLFRRKDGQTDVEPVNAEVRITTGALEGSNVNAVEALTGMIELSRQFELNVKMMKAAEENDTSSARLLQS